MKTYKHLIKEERDLIAVYLAQGYSLRLIANKLDRSPGTILRELRRNRPTRGRQLYLPHKAQERASARHHEGHKHKRLKTFALRLEIQKQLMNGWSPEIISGRIKKEGKLPPISHEAIYQWVYEEAHFLIGYLPRAHRRRYPKRHGRKHHKSHIPERVSILDRPQIIASRQETGHWETDLVVGQGREALQVTVERMSRFTRMIRLPDKTSHSSSRALMAMMSSLPPELRRSVTYDNGSENVEHVHLNRSLGMASYFCEPFHSWEKGTVENTNGLIRRFIPKGTNLATIPQEEIKRVETWLNTRPRKCLGFQTPAEFLKSLGVALTG